MAVRLLQQVWIGIRTQKQLLIEKSILAELRIRVSYFVQQLIKNKSKLNKNQEEHSSNNYDEGSDRYGNYQQYNEVKRQDQLSTTKKQCHTKKLMSMYDLCFQSQSNNSTRKKRIQFKSQLFVVDHRFVNTQKQLKINQQTVYFPHQPYDVQVRYMQSVLEALQNKNNALLQSPTGTGKTLCLLSSVLSWVENNYVKNGIKTKVIYMSRTHSQLQQISKQLQKTCYRPTMAIFGSRDQLCIKKELSNLKGIQKDQACCKAVKAQKKLLRKLAKGKEIDPQLKQRACQFYRDKEEFLLISERQLMNTIVDIQKMKNIGQEDMFCPFLYPSNIKSIATLFVMPYNYLLSEILLPNNKQIITDSIIIFDEAHNVAQSACQGKSFSFQASHLEEALDEINYIFQYKWKIKQRYEKELNFILRNLQDYKENFRKYGQKIFRNYSDPYKKNSNKEQPQPKLIRKEQTELNIFQIFCGNIIKDEKKPQFFKKRDYYKARMKQYLINPLGELIQYGEKLIQAIKETSNGRYSHFEQFLTFITKIKQLITPAIFKDLNQSGKDTEIVHYRLHITQDPNNQEIFTFGLKCLVPWLAFKSLEALNPRSIILTSGTLKPLQIWQKELQMCFATQLTNQHVIKKDQINCKVISSGPSKDPFLFTFDNLNKKKDALYTDLIKSVIIICKEVPHGVLLVFPSFRLQKEFKQYLFNSPEREKLFKYKDIIFQEKNANTNLEQFKEKAYSSKGAILVMVCRGKLSEGIDFPDEMCRAVIMISIPYPNIKDPWINQKKKHLQQLASQSKDKSKCLGGQQWYQTGTFRSMNQALGRVIRHVQDYGMVFLFEKRFLENNFKRHLPEWIRQSITHMLSPIQTLGQEIEEFYSGMKLRFPIKQENTSEYDDGSSNQNANSQTSSGFFMNKRHSIKKPRKEYDFS